VAVVGNGPSASGRGGEIDACDFVVRCNWFWRYFPGWSSGRKLSALCIYPEILSQVLAEAPKGDWELWFSTPNAPKRVPRPARPIGRGAYETLYRRLKSLGRPNRSASNCWPTTGLVALSMALSMEPEQVYLVGFDALTPQQPGWGDNGVSFRPRISHNYLAEKDLIRVMLEQLAGEWSWIRL
jgi:hypothetical protein